MKWLNPHVQVIGDEFLAHYTFIRRGANTFGHIVYAILETHVFGPVTRFYYPVNRKELHK